MSRDSHPVAPNLGTDTFRDTPGPGFVPAILSFPERPCCGTPQAVDTDSVRQAFVHDAVVTMEAGGDVRAPGAAITVALCGHWKHEAPCPLAPHCTDAQRSGDQVRLRVLFAVEPAAEAEVRRRIEAALSRARLTGPDGVTTRWQLRSEQPGLLRDDEAQHAEGFIRN
jgi:hypothetical protein